MTSAYILVLIYTGAQMIALPRDDLEKCAKEARDRVGELAEVTAWDTMGGSNPIPKVVFAFCAKGTVAK
jgi:hypothetical protein